MAAAKPVRMDPEVKPEVTPEVTPEVVPEVTPEVAPSGPVIEYVGEGAEDVKFTVNPLATKYVVRSDGMILETF